jgi:hypothetical protein
MRFPNERTVGNRAITFCSILSVLLARCLSASIRPLENRAHIRGCFDCSFCSRRSLRSRVSRVGPTHANKLGFAARSFNRSL